MIHCIWLGKGTKPETFASVYASWQKFAPGFTIRIWTEDDVSEFQLPVYFRRAMSQHRWALASDVLRFAILAKYGGIYLDVDQVLIRSIDTDEILNHKAILSLYHEVDDYCGFGFIGCVQNAEFARRMLAYYANHPNDGYEIVNRIGSKIALDLVDSGDMYVFSQDYFYPLTDADRTEHTYSYHLANTSWVSWWKRYLQVIPGYTIAKKCMYRVVPRSILARMGLNIQY